MTASGTSEDRRVRVFISYSHRGKGLEWKNELLSQLAVFEKHGVLDVWHDDEMKLGENWHERINAAMKGAKLAMLLLTDEFLKSPFVLQHELPILQRLHQEGALLIAPILCEECGWPANTWLASLQIKPREQATPIPLTSLSNREQVLRQLATEIAVELGAAALKELPRCSQTTPATSVYLDKFPLTRGPGLREEKLIGREQELALLDLAFSQPHTAIVTLVAWGGVGKTMLVQYWLQRLQWEGWFGAQRVYAWSFYSQDTKEDRQSSEDSFLAHALERFGVQCEPTLSPWDKGRLLAEAVARERTLFILDGIEPLQYPPGPMGGQLRAPGVQSLLKHIARKANAGEKQGLCLITTREPLTDLADFQCCEGSWWGSLLRVDLGNLTDEAGAALLHHAGANRAGAAEIKPGDKELLAASGEVDGHALTLNLLGRFLARAHSGNIRRRDLVKFEEADRDEQGGKTFKMLAAFENWFANEGDIEARALAILRMLGLFDRPADTGCMAVLRKPPVIAGLTGSLFTLRHDSTTGQPIEQPLTDKTWNDAIHFLFDFGLAMIQADPCDPGCLLDCHPLIREHFAKEMGDLHPTAWRSAHRRLYQHLIVKTIEFPRTLLEMEPLFHGSVHGCKAGLNDEVITEVYRKRIQQAEIDKDNDYCITNLGGYTSELTVQAAFFDKPWDPATLRMAPEEAPAFLNETANNLWSQNRNEEALILYRHSLALAVNQKNKTIVTWVTGNVADILFELGRMREALQYSEACAWLTDELQVAEEQVYGKVALATVWLVLGERERALSLFEDAERLQAICEPERPLLYHHFASSYASLLLTDVEREAWAISMSQSPYSALSHLESSNQVCASVENRLTTVIKWHEDDKDLLGVAFDRLSLGCVALFQAVLNGYSFDEAENRLSCAEREIRGCGNRSSLSDGLLPLVWLRKARGKNSESIMLLDEAWEISERGAMRLHVADIHLYRARLFFREKEYPWRVGQNLNGELVTNRTAADDLAAAEKLINDCGYHLCDKELGDAKRAILGAA